MTDPDSSTLLAEPDETTEDEASRSRREPVHMSRFWMIGFPLALIVVVVAGVIVALSGKDNILGNTGVSEVPQAIEDPNAPGWTAVVEPTRTAMVAHTDGTGVLTAVSILVGDEDEVDGGSVLVLPADTEVTLPDETEPILLSALFDEDGADGLSIGVGSLVGFGFTEGASVLDSQALEQLLNLAAPLEITVIDPISTAEGETMEPGVHELDAAESVVYFEVLGDGEAPLNRIDRQRQIWTALIAELADNPDMAESAAAQFEVVGEMLSELSSGPVNDISLPVTVEVADDEQLPVFVISSEDADQIASMSASMVPLPIAPYPGARARLELSDGAGDAIARDAAIPALTTAGAELVLLRNELVFDLERSEVVYYEASFAEIASAMAQAIGAPEPTLLQSEGPLFDVEITLGMDWEP